MSTEEIYDNEINPLMARIIEIARAHNIPFHATFLLEDAEGKPVPCSTHSEPEVDIRMRMLYWAALCQGNVDLFIIWLMRHAKEHGHSSVFLTSLENKECSNS